MSGRRILVVDDDPSDCELVILDVHLPSYDAPEVFALLRKKHLSRRVNFLGLPKAV